MSAFGDAITALGLTVLSETGDKSQLLLIALAARWRRAPVAVGGVLGITGVQLLAVAAGGLLSSRADGQLATTIAVVVGIVFVVLGLVALASARAPEQAEPDDEALVNERRSASWLSTVGLTAGLLFAAELGDKTMFTTAALSAVRSPVAVLVGASAAFAILATIAVLIGGAFADRVPERALKVLAGGAFLVTGVVTIITA
ncbi:MAG: TMEM165/GDT1 family protein [Acidimicrobiales bacterium]